MQIRKLFWHRNTSLFSQIFRAFRGKAVSLFPERRVSLYNVFAEIASLIPAVPACFSVPHKKGARDALLPCKFYENNRDKTEKISVKGLKKSCQPK
ncbi:MAG: hypothetical protein SOW68_02010 [Eubacteriales bacterium]|nr:hypothetical protein [Eubacteriales bacterium]